MSSIKKNSVIEVEIDDLAYGGMGVGRVDGFVYFVKRAVPGDRVSARVRKKKSNHAECDLLEILKPASERVDPRCELFGSCGGCVSQMLEYEQQLKWKQKQVADVIQRIGGQAAEDFLPTKGSPEIWNYRNKMEYSFGSDPDGDVILGFHVPRRFDQIFDVPMCHIHPKPFDGLLDALRRYARDHGLTAYDQRSHQGFLRHAVMRHSTTTGGVVLMLITNEGELPAQDRLDEELKHCCPQLQGWRWGINRGVADVAVCEEIRFESGDLQLVEKINDLEFEISPTAFFQTNTRAAEILYQATIEIAGLDSRANVLDAYCGAGAIGLHAARSAGRIVGVEINREAVWNARANAARNGVSNATFISSPMAGAKQLIRHAASGEFSHVIIDPPRGGMDKKSLSELIAFGAPVFIYVSCNPATLARDIQTLGNAGYRLKTIQPIDMFPHTFHIETIVRLEKA